MWRLLCYITSILKAKLIYVRCSENVNMQLSGRLIVQGAELQCLLKVKDDLSLLIFQDAKNDVSN